MNFAFIIFIAIALAIDAFSIALAAGAYFGKTSSRQKFRLSFHFGLFQFFMPILGWLAGSEIVSHISAYDHWIAFAVLSIIGIRMICHSLNHDSATISKDITRSYSLISLSLATSIDALAVGFSLGVIGSEIILPSMVIGFIAAGMTLLGIGMGEFLARHVGQKIVAFGGVVLIFIGIHIVLEHLHIY